MSTLSTMHLGIVICRSPGRARGLECYESSRNSNDGTLPLTLPSPPGLGERVRVRGFMRVKTKMGTFIISTFIHLVTMIHIGGR